MRKNLILFLLIVCSTVFMAALCEKDDSDLFACEEYQEPEISRSFVISANIYYADYIPYKGPVNFTIKKLYCDGTESGNYALDHISSDSQGDWFSGMVYTYKFANQKDKVLVKFHIIDTNSSTYINSEYVITYSEVQSQSGNIMAEYDIKLTWASPQVKK